MIYFASCLKCTGDLVLEDDEWRCLQCGRYYYPRSPYLSEINPAGGQKRRRSPSGGVAGRNINSLIDAQSRKQERYPQVIAYLNEGRTVREIAALTGLSPRAIRSARERSSEPVLA